MTGHADPSRLPCDRHLPATAMSDTAPSPAVSTGTVFIRRSRVHPLTSLTTPVARRKYIKEHLLVICAPRAGSSVWEMLPARSAIVGRMREGGVLCEVVDDNDPGLQNYTTRLRRAAVGFLTRPDSDQLVDLLHSEVEMVGRYDATLRRIERIDRPDPLVAWLDPEPLPPDARDSGPDYLMRLWEDVVAALGLPAVTDPTAVRRASKQIGFLAEDYQSAGLTRGADELGMLAMWLESQQTPAPTPPED